MDEELKELWRDSSTEDRERLAYTLTALRSVADEEIPRKISFVSDRVFEPKWWQRFPAWGFASASVLAAAIVAHGYLARPMAVSMGTAPPAIPAAAKVDTAAIEKQFEKRLDAALKKATLEYDTKLAAERRKMDLDRQALRIAVEESFDQMQKRMNVLYLASTGFSGEPGGN